MSETIKKTSNAKSKIADMKKDVTPPPAIKDMVDSGVDGKTVMPSVVLSERLQAMDNDDGISNEVRSQKDVPRDENGYVEIQDTITGMEGEIIPVDKTDIDPIKADGILSSMYLIEEENKKLKEKIDKDILDAGGVEEYQKAVAVSLKDEEEAVKNKKKGLPVKVKKYDEFEAPDTDDIDSILADMEKADSANELGVDLNDVDTLLQRMEEEKVFCSFTDFDDVEAIGVSDFTVVENTEYIDMMMAVCDINDIKVSNATTPRRNAVIESYSDNGQHVTGTLTGSGLWITLSGMSTGEIIAMNSSDEESNPTVEALNKLGVVFSHCVNTSIGKMSTKYGISLISWDDIDTLFYYLFIASNPKNTDIIRECDKCGNDFYHKVNGRTLLLNPERFKEKSEYIKHSSTFKEAVDASDLGKIYRKRLSNGSIVDIKNESIKSVISINSKITNNTRRKYTNLFELAYSVDAIYLPDPINAGGMIKYNEPNEVIELINKLPADCRYELVDYVEGIKDSEKPVYGFEKTTCPHCTSVIQESPISMQKLLFFTAQQIEETKATERAVLKMKEANELKTIKK